MNYIWYNDKIGIYWVAYFYREFIREKGVVPRSLLHH